LDKNTDTKVAIKKIPKAFDDLIDAKRILREVKLLHHFHHENIIGLRDLIPPPDKTPFEDIYIGEFVVINC
jgi:serine/threonine protein kinase